MDQKTDFEKLTTLSKALASSTLLPVEMINKEANVLFAILAGHELGLAPMASIRGIHVIKGKPVLAADTMVAIVLKSALCEYFRLVEETDTFCTYETKRRNNPSPTRYSYTKDDQLLAGLNSGNHAAHPKAMRRARCKSILARSEFPDVLAGVYSAEEFEDAEIVSPLEIAKAAAQIDAGEIIGKIRASKTIADLKAQGIAIAKLALPAEAQAQIRAAYSLQIEHINAGPAPVAELVAK
jgi:hypothetical protein